MAMFGSSWLEDESCDDRPMFGRHWLDETHHLYILDENTNEIIQIENKKQYHEAIDNNRLYEFDGKNYNLKQ